MYYGVATVSMIGKIIGVFCKDCKRALQKRLYSTKESYNFIDPPNRSHPIIYVFFYSQCTDIFYFI